MNAVEQWFSQAEKVFQGNDPNQLFDRLLRSKGEVDRAVIEYLMLQELRAIREALQKSDKGHAKGTRSAKR